MNQIERNYLEVEERLYIYKGTKIEREKQKEKEWQKRCNLWCKSTAEKCYFLLPRNAPSLVLAHQLLGVTTPNQKCPAKERLVKWYDKAKAGWCAKKWIKLCGEYNFARFRRGWEFAQSLILQILTTIYILTFCQMLKV